MHLKTILRAFQNGPSAIQLPLTRRSWTPGEGEGGGVFYKRKTTRGSRHLAKGRRIYVHIHICSHFGSRPRYSPLRGNRVGSPSVAFSAQILVLSLPLWPS